MKSTWFPRRHDSAMAWYHDIEAGKQPTTICPLVMYDEGKGDPASFNSNPAHASFAETDEPNCYPESKIEKIQCAVTFQMGKFALETDKLHRIRCAFMVISSAFDDLDAKDEVSGETLKTILEYQTETTDRQSYPLWNTVDMPVLMTGLNILPASVPSLTATQAIEGVAFSPDTYYDALHYFTNGKKLARVTSGLKWFNLTRQNPTRTFLINLKSSSKFMNEYAQTGLMVHVPLVDNVYSRQIAGDTTTGNHVDIYVQTRYNEWNEHFDHSRT